MSTIPAHQPILDALLSLQAFNERVGLVAEITRANFEGIESSLTADIKRVQSERLSQDEARRLRDRMQALAVRKAGDAYTTYVLLKLHEAGDYLASVVAATLAYPPESSLASFVRDALQRWIATISAEERTRLLERFDRGYRERRLRFIIAGVNDRYTSQPKTKWPVLNTVKAELYALLTELWSATAPQALERELTDVPREPFPAVSATTPDSALPDPAHFADTRGTELHALVERVGAVLDQRFTMRCTTSAPSRHVRTVSTTTSADASTASNDC